MENIILDCDGVLLDWEKGFSLWLQRVHGINVDPQGPTSWDLSPWLGFDKDVCMGLVDTFNKSRFFADLEPCQGATAAVEELVWRGLPLRVVTSCHHFEEVGRRRFANLEAVFGDVFTEIVCLGLGVCKQPVLTGMAAGVWVEDNYKNALAGAAAGHHATVIRRPHNRTHETADSLNVVTWVDGLRDLLPIVDQKLSMAV